LLLPPTATWMSPLTSSISRHCEFRRESWGYLSRLGFPRVLSGMLISPRKFQKFRLLVQFREPESVCSARGFCAQPSSVSFEATGFCFRSAQDSCSLVIAVISDCSLDEQLQ
jgi:hypothetical protein